jgi:hypothetical protein
VTASAKIPVWLEREKGHAERAITALQSEMTLAEYSQVKSIDEYYPTPNCIEQYYP